MQRSDVKSRPIYAALQASPHAHHHVVAAEGEGALAVLAAFGAHPTLLASTTLIYVPGSSIPAGHDAMLAALSPDAFVLCPSTETALVRLRATLSTATMGTAIYLCGGESFVGQAFTACVAAGVDGASIQTEHRGSLARRVQCVHCKGFTDEVRRSPVTCRHCGIALLVRDHYSRRLGAFMGVSIDAEAPGDVPEPEEIAS